MVLKLALAGALAFVYRNRDTAQAQPAAPLVAATQEGLARELAPAPIEPSWILSGTPQARAAQHVRSADRCSSVCMWDCTAGTFRWFFGEDETVVILDGEVFVTAEDGMQRMLRSGDIAYFRGGTWATWRIDRYVRKIAFIRQPLWQPIALFYRLRNRLRSVPKPASFDT
ncbi:cupin domain-containing protein [Rhizobium sp. SSA_523]|uniref:cupin domain-containing protein n=1 Tax=Rhizobium sp. SSA_523 TaxID=2952477 RepID=UPI002090C5DB|nr:cupin domain-containing protein [Rhizobium sp. SSA_523]MCO5732695.1 cupin domain-containing protein [Rhizobium sp. SSA_523]WKC23678.1 cupin domain-containing protein [Rhizobium sp. SSA_523]